jgi:hypothetical protein
MKKIINAALTLALMGVLGVVFTHQAAAQAKGTGTGVRSTLFVDQNGDGICDNFGTKAGQGLGNGSLAKGRGPGDGTGNMGQGPKDGTGYGAKTGTCTGTGTGLGTGTCDMTGPKGGQMRRGNK